MVDTSMGHSLLYATRNKYLDEEHGLRADDDSSIRAQDELQNPHEIVHREQNQPLQAYPHRKAHRRQQSSADTNAAGVAILEVTSTVSLVQQVDVNPAGSIVSTEYIPLPTSTILPVSTTAPTTTTTSPPATGVTSAPSTATNRFPSYTAGSNSSIASSTSYTSSGSLSSSITSNSTSKSSPSSTSSWRTSFSSEFTVSTTSSSVPATSFISSTQPSSPTATSSASSYFPHSTAGSGSEAIAPIASSIPSAGGASSTSGAAHGSNGGRNAPTATVIASVFGSIAGVALILVILLFLVKWHKRRLAASQALPGSLDGGARGLGAPDNGPPPQPMSDRARFALPTGLANLCSFKPNRASRQTMRTLSSTAGSEQGFVRVGGRKIQSVLESGGDGFGDPPLSINPDGTSFFQQQGGSNGGHGNGPPSPAAMGHQESGIPSLRPSPARTPIIEHTAPFSDLNLEQPPPSRPDGSALNRPSLDGSQTGSHASRFTEDV